MGGLGCCYYVNVHTGPFIVQEPKKSIIYYTLFITALAVHPKPSARRLRRSILGERSTKNPQP